MSAHDIFYYPYASFTGAQAPLLKIAALYFDHLYLLDPEKASSGIIGVGEAAEDVQLLEQEKILVRVAPEDVLEKFEAPIAEAIRADLNDPDFKQLCEQSGRADRWTLALAKIPKSIRNDPQFRPLDTAMQRFMGELPRTLAPDVARYTEVYQEATRSLYQEQFVYDEMGGTPGGGIEYRYADYPLPLGEAIMVNHALFAGLLFSVAIPLTDDPFHNKVLALKMQRAGQIPAIRQALEDRAYLQKLTADQMAAIVLRDPLLKLPALDPKMPLHEVLEFRKTHAAELEQARYSLEITSRRIKAEPWSKEFADELDHSTIPDIASDLVAVGKARDSWLRDRKKRILSGAGIAFGAAAAVLALVAAPLTPVALASAAVGLASGGVIPGAEWLVDWRNGKKTVQENGLHYLLAI